MRILPFILLSLFTFPPIFPRAAFAREKSVAPATVRTLTLSEALARALRRNPDLATFSYDNRAGEARVLQAGIKPNPEASLTFENFAGTRGRGPAAATESTLEFSQLLELGGKREARVREAEAAKALLEYDYEEKKRNVFHSVATDFISVLGAQERVALQEDIAGLAEELRPDLDARVKAGRASVAEQTRNEVAIANANVALMAARQGLATARRKLAFHWAATEADFETVRGDIATLPSVGPLEKYMAAASSHPSVARWEAEAERRRALVRREQANGTEDVKVGAGVRWLNGPDEATFVGGISIALPLRNKNEGNIREAEAMEAKVGAERKSAEFSLSLAIREAYGRVQLARTTAKLIDRSVITNAQRTVDAVKEGFPTGRFSSLEMLEARRTINDARVQRLDALIESHKAAAALDALTGGHRRADTKH